MIRLYVKCEAESPADAVFCAWSRGKKPGVIAAFTRGQEKSKSGREDSNLRPHGPEPCALTGLRYAPNEVIINALLQVCKRSGRSV